MIKVVLIRINVVRPICDSLVGEHHTFRHRAMIGVLVMLVGVMIAKSLGHSSYHIVAVVGDAIGYGLHGIGLIPFAEAIVSSEK